MEYGYPNRDLWHIADLFSGFGFDNDQGVLLSRDTSELFDLCSRCKLFVFYSNVSITRTSRARHGGAAGIKKQFDATLTIPD